MLRILYLFTLIYLLTACASTCIETDDVVEVQRGTYTVYAYPNHPFGNQWNTSRDVALAKANAFCERKGKQASVKHIDNSYRTDITFECITVN